MSAYRVRFANTVCAPSPSAEIASILDPSVALPSDRALRKRSRSGCFQCKKAKVKCDELFPVCLRCLQRHLLCKSSPRLSTWQVEMRWVPSTLGAIVKVPLLQYWLEQASQMLVIDPENNPFSFPIIRYLTEAPSLLHIIQSLGAAHQEYFPARGPIVSLEEKGRALQMLQREMVQSKKPEECFLTISLLGLSHWANSDPRDFGQQHLFAARGITDHLLSRDRDIFHQPGNGNDNLLATCFGSFLYWDMCCAHLVDARQQRPLDTTPIAQAVRALRAMEHPTYGPAAELIYILCQVGRYCREVIQLGHQDIIKATALHQQLCAFPVLRNNSSLALLYDSFKMHGLILLYRNSVHSARLEDETKEDRIHKYAIKIACNLSEIPLSSNLLNIQALPLLTAASELRSYDTELRQALVARFKAIYSMNRVPSTLLAISLLEEIWEIRDTGLEASWMGYMILTKKWSLLLG
ncbi:uncharacterized protein N7446_005130 [Penicillium canescens]|uniref:Zn(2)-C6 fungal-type domain-containing protein n=1 Tax=Penicillium canescens TaxID=5083 RepID=A0AAD6N7B6_PENCN|nr:uncharacterized protein N7446_005130 [Penicillium canescens]KAJ6038326.1 hypothetical protein N7460_008097 [Penicillium canescens]KAJ6039557.1 hypothetical protein N7444_008462 [Penicillium canescens]KAJ6068093.1 hypothetical protein N7446_005130 [Penicillium canescens]